MSFLPEAQHLALLLCKLTVRQSQKPPPLTSGQKCLLFIEKCHLFSRKWQVVIFFQRKNDLCISLEKKNLKDPALMRNTGNNSISFSLYLRSYFVNSEITLATTDVACRQMSRTTKARHLVFQECSLHAGWICVISAPATSSPNLMTLTLQSFYVPIQDHNLVREKLLCKHARTANFACLSIMMPGKYVKCFIRHFEMWQSKSVFFTPQISFSHENTGKNRSSVCFFPSQVRKIGKKNKEAREMKISGPNTLKTKREGI